MESQYNQLLSISKTVSAFFENVYAPILQTLPWIDKGDGLKTASEKVLGNIAFPAYELSTYKSQNENQQTIEHLRVRCNKLESIYQQMQDELQPVLAMMPAEDRTWEKLQEMIPKWKNYSSSDLLSKSMHKAIEESFASVSYKEIPATATALIPTATGTATATADDVLAKLMAEKITYLHREGESDHSIALTFGYYGYWLDRGFLNTIRGDH